MPRLFIALPLTDDNLKLKTIEPVNSYFLKYGKELKVVRLENYHITLKFLGECSSKIANKIEENFENITEIKKIIPFTLFGIGVFPDLQKPNVIWAGLKTDEVLINRLIVDIETFSFSFGFKKDKKTFLPHLTLARVRKGKDLSENLRQYIVENKNIFFYESSFKKLSLIESKLSDEGPSYTELKSIKFDTNNNTYTQKQ